MLLAGDIGGTKTKLAIFSTDQGPREPVVEGTFPSQEYDDLESIAHEFLKETGLDVDQASFGVAGPVIENRAEVTNLGWVVSANQLREALDVSSVKLLNDLAAIANGVPFLEPDEIHTLQEGTRAPLGAIAVIAPGTGLGEAFMTWDGKHYQPRASEGGHTDFAPATPQQAEILNYLWKDLDHVSVEAVCSGRGIPNIYRYFKEHGAADEPASLTEEIAEADDPTPVISNAALDGRSDLCILTMETFVSILGAEAGNMALKVMATGGVYLGGGIPPRILTLLKQKPFLQAFYHKGRLSDLMTRIPVHVILNPETALFGAACYGLGL